MKSLIKFFFLSLSIFQLSFAAVWYGDFGSFSSWNINDSYGSKFRSIISDPKGSGEKVLKVTFPAGHYTNGVDGGTGFYVYPFSNLNAQNATLEYDIMFPTSFNWVKGGKLPGIFGAKQSCTGRNPANDCFSARFMWGKNGNGYPYLYIPKDAPHLTEFCSYTQYKDCKRDYAFAFNQTKYFEKDKWIRVKEKITLNTVGKANGVLQVWIDGIKKVYYNKVIFRTLSSVAISGFQIETFFGGSTSDWATDTTTYVLFKSFKFMDS